MLNLHLFSAGLEDKGFILQLMEKYYNYDGIHFDIIKADAALRVLLSNAKHGQAYLIKIDNAAAGYIVLTNGFSLEFGGTYQYVSFRHVSYFIAEKQVKQAFKHV